MTGKSKKVGAGGPTVITASEEHDIVLACTTLGDMGYGMMKDLVNALPQREKETQSLYQWYPWKRLVAKISETMALFK